MTKVIETHPELEELLKEFKTETVAEQALNMLDGIPEPLWFTGAYSSPCGTRHCALGWLNFKENWPEEKNPPIARKAHEFLGLRKGSNLSHINDGKDFRYTQPTPKQRVIALLQDMIKAGY